MKLSIITPNTLQHASGRSWSSCLLTCCPVHCHHHRDSVDGRLPAEPISETQPAGRLGITVHDRSCHTVVPLPAIPHMDEVHGGAHGKVDLCFGLINEFLVEATGGIPRSARTHRMRRGAMTNCVTTIPRAIIQNTICCGNLLKRTHVT